MSTSQLVDYHLLSVNAGIIGAIFIFFSVASMASDFSIFNFNSVDCSYGFNLEPTESQIAITVAVGIILVPFAISSLMILLKNNHAGIFTSIGFALIIASTIMIIASLSCRIPYEFITGIMIVPAIVAIGVTTLLFLFKRLNIRDLKRTQKINKKEDGFTVAS